MVTDWEEENEEREGEERDENRQGGRRRAGPGVLGCKACSAEAKKCFRRGYSVLCCECLVTLSLFTQQTPVRVSLLRRQAALPVCCPHVSM